MKEENKPSYYAIIPSEVRYCEELKYPERLLYGEITALAGKEGYCFATNKYFAELYHVIPGTISRWVNHLERLGFVKTEIIKDQRNQILERRIYINERYRMIISNTYEQKKQYPYGQNSIYPMGRNDKDNNINIRIDRFFNFIINKEYENPEIQTKEEQEEFFKVIKKLEFDYTEELINLFTEDNIEKVKIIIYALKELWQSNKKQLINKAIRDNLIFLYDNCKRKQLEYEGTSKEINNFFEYYYVSLIKELEKAK